MKDTTKLFFLYVQVHQGRTAEDIMNMIAEVEGDESFERRKELSEAYAYLLKHQHIKVDDKTNVVSVRGVV